MPQSNDPRDVDADDRTTRPHTEAVAPFENDDPRRSQRYGCAAAADTPPPALIEAADLAGIFARSQAALDRARVEGRHSSVEQCSDRVWPRVRQRWTLIESGLAAVAADTLSLQALRHEVALADAWQRFAGEPEEREALLAMYAALVAHLPWPEGFARAELLEAFLLE